MIETVGELMAQLKKWPPDFKLGISLQPTDKPYEPKTEYPIIGVYWGSGFTLSIDGTNEETPSGKDQGLQGDSQTQDHHTDADQGAEADLGLRPQQER